MVTFIKSEIKLLSSKPNQIHTFDIGLTIDTLEMQSILCVKFKRPLYERLFIIVLSYSLKAWRF